MAGSKVRSDGRSGRVPERVRTSRERTTRTRSARERRPQGAPPAGSDARAPTTPEARGNVIPRPGRFFGREEYLADLAELFASGERLVTLIGPPGIGKTRLALRFAEAHADAFREGGTWFCDLTSARTATDVAAIVADVLNVPLSAERGGEDGLAQLGRAIAHRGRILIVLDNFEQVASAGALTVGRWVTAAERACFLVTSREALELALEVRREVTPLRQEHAVELFVARARAVRQGFTPEGGENHSVRALVERLDGIPLALELAAARMGVLSASDLLARLADQTESLRDGRRDAASRHRTLSAAIASSWEPLAPWQQRALARCAVFRSGFTREAFATVALAGESPDDPLAALQGLRDKSLLRVEEAPDAPGELRFRLYECVREFGDAWLADRGGRDEAARRHAEHYTLVGETAARGARSRGGYEHLRRLARESENLHAAFAWGLEHAPALAARIALALDIHLARGPSGTRRAVHDAAIGAADRAGELPLRVATRCVRAVVLRREGRNEAALADAAEALSLAESGGDVSARIEALREVGRAQLSLGSREAAVATLEGALSLARQADDREATARTLYALSHAALGARRFVEAVRLQLESLAIFEALGDERAQADALGGLAILMHKLGREADAQDYIERMLDLNRVWHDPVVEGWGVATLGSILVERGDLDRAREHYLRALEILGPMGNPYREAACHINLGIVAHLRGELDAARREFRASLAVDSTLLPRAYVPLALAHAAAVDAEAGALVEAEAGLARAGEIARAQAPHVLAGPLELLGGALDVGRARAVAATDPAEAARSFARAQGRCDARDPRRAAEPPDDDTRVAWHVLRAVIERARAADRDGPLSGPVQALTVGPDADWVQLPEGPVVDLAEKRVLARLLLALVRQHDAHPGTGLSVEQVFASAWPGERCQPAAMKNRVWVAVATLRKLGLRSWIAQRGGKYLLDPALGVRVSDRPLPSRRG